MLSALSETGRNEERGSEVWYEIVHERLVSVVKFLDSARESDYLAFSAARDIISNGSRSDMWRTYPDALLTRGQVDSVVAPYKERLTAFEARD